MSEEGLGPMEKRLSDNYSSVRIDKYGKGEMFYPTEMASKIQARINPKEGAFPSIARMINTYTNLAKNSQLFQMGFHLTITVDSLFKNYLMDVPSRRYADVFLVNRGLKSVTAGGKKMTGKELAGLAKRNGVISEVTAFSDFTDPGKSKLLTGKVLKAYNATKHINPFSSKFILFNANRKFGEFHENYIRYAMFIDLLEKGDSVIAAAKMV